MADIRAAKRAEEAEVAASNLLLHRLAERRVTVTSDPAKLRADFEAGALVDDEAWSLVEAKDADRASQESDISLERSVQSDLSDSGSALAALAARSAYGCSLDVLRSPTIPWAVVVLAWIGAHGLAARSSFDVAACPARQTIWAYVAGCAIVFEFVCADVLFALLQLAMPQRRAKISPTYGQLFTRYPMRSDAPQRPLERPLAQVPPESEVTPHEPLAQCASAQVL